MSEPADNLPEGATLLEDGTVSYTLRWPVKYTIGNTAQKLENITVRRKNFADNRAIKKLDNPVDIGFTLFMRLTGLEAHLADQIDDVDQEAFGRIVDSFTKPGPATQTSAQDS